MRSEVEKLKSEVSILGKTGEEGSVETSGAYFLMWEPAKTHVDSLHVLVQELLSLAVKPTILAEDIAEAVHVLRISQVLKLQPILIAKVLDQRTSPANSIADPRDEGGGDEMRRDVRGSVGVSDQVLVPAIDVKAVERVVGHVSQGCVVLNSVNGNMTARFILGIQVDGGVERGEVETRDTHFYWMNFDERVEEIIGRDDEG